jgi:mutator protein MutT
VNSVPSAPLPIGIAVVERDGRYLVGVRPDGTPLDGYAEFPGGKCEPGEPPDACAVRECREEAGLDVEPVRLLDRRTWDYPHARVELSFFLCRPIDAKLPAAQFRWVSREELAALRFPEANAVVMKSLTETPGP